MSCRLLVYTHAYIHTPLCIYIHTHYTHPRTSKQTHSCTYTNTHTLSSVVKKSCGFNVICLGKARVDLCLSVLFLSKRLKTTEHADVGVLTAHRPPGKKERAYTTSWPSLDQIQVSKSQKQLKKMLLSIYWIQKRDKKKLHTNKGGKRY